jgi:hypothetical protein
MAGRQLPAANDSNSKRLCLSLRLSSLVAGLENKRSGAAFVPADRNQIAVPACGEVVTNETRVYTRASFVGPLSLISGRHP